MFKFIISDSHAFVRGVAYLGHELSYLQVADRFDGFISCTSPWPSVFSVVNRFYLTVLSVSNVAIDY